MDTNRCRWGISLVTMALLVGCGGRSSPLGGPYEAPDGGTPDAAVASVDGVTSSDAAPASCDGLDQATCTATPGCVPAICSGGCDGRPPQFVGCQVDDGRELCGGTPYCPAPPPRCDGLDQTSCENNPACQADYCYDCTALAPVFTGCRDASLPAQAPNTPCPNAPPTCTHPTPGCEAKEQADCDASPDCHSVYYDAGPCQCATAGCCTYFDHCAPGKAADCAGPATCETDAAVTCEGPYVVSYANGCYEGCVLASECTQPGEG
jgi:hypothetical protein